MESTKKLLGFLLLLWITSDAADSFPDSFSKNEISSSRNHVGVSSQIISNALLQGQAESTSNYVASPLGYAIILSILARGAIGKTKEEILNVLEQPNNYEDIKSSYRSALMEFTSNSSLIPQFKTFFYIYKNNTVSKEFREALMRDYLADVKDIERFDMGFDSSDSTRFDYTEQSQPTNSKDILLFEELKNSNPNEKGELDEKFDTLKIADDNTEEVVKDAIEDYDQLDKDEKVKVSKFDKEVDDKQYVEKSEIVTEKIEEMEETTLINDENLNENNGPEKIVLPLKKYSEDSMEIMEAQENRQFVNRFGRAQPLHFKGDITSALSGNSIMGRKSKSSSESESKMLLFNGLYYRGDWAQSFKVVESLKTFNGIKNEKKDTKYIVSSGLFKYAEIESQNLIVVELPYKNDRYALLIIMPKTNNDMKQFCKQTNYNNLNEIISQMENSNLDLYLPVFRYECTSHAEKALGKLGLTTLFTSKADLSGISQDAKGYQIEELVQHVAIRIDEGSSGTSALSAGNVQGRQNSKSTEALIDKPFVFYVRDTLKEIILTTGKVMEIPIENEEIPITFVV
ncbi:hypothetical protein PVAND_011360 [Polypedilum vanderplanki]|uniref:Serpin domain-containing protein n=1 Tax=Polypedilum vanderplanki TaxID=319348 RepID=A0A9J6CJB2_POLVA|nr:hypothetical protein PVAND_011360 [Polypedilum vanderplanki]